MTTTHSLPGGAQQTSPTAAKAKVAQIPFDEAVRQGKSLAADTAKGDRAWMRLGELADNVEQRYADRTLKRYADAIGAEYESVKRCRTTYRQWKKIGAPAPLSYSAAQVLAKHPDAAAIASDDPNITKEAARKLVQEYKERTDDKKKGADGLRKHYEAWQRKVQNAADAAIGSAASADQKLTTDQRRILRDVVEPSLIPLLMQSAEAQTKLAERLRGLLAEQEEERRAA